MSPPGTSADDEHVSITLRRDDLYLLLAYLSHAKFAGEIKSYVMLSPLMNELFKAILSFSDETGATDSSSASWRRQITPEEADHPESFAWKVKEVLKRDLGEEKAEESLRDALFPNQLLTDTSASAKDKRVPELP